MASVVFLKGVNVGGHRRFRPSVLAGELRHLDVVSIGAAGTFVVRSRVGQDELRAEIAARLPFETEMVVCRSREVTDLLSGGFFDGRPVRADVVRFVSVLARAPRAGPEAPLQLPPSGRWLVKVLAREGRFVVGEHRREIKAIGELGKLERVFGAAATARSWSTLIKVGKALEDSLGQGG